MSILSSRELWFSDFRGFADDEPRFLKRIAERTLERIETSSRTRHLLATTADPAVVDQFPRTWRRFRDRFVQLNIFHGQNAVPFVFSLSSDHDCPALWRRYGSEICIEFCRDALQRATGLAPLKICYARETDIDANLADALDQFLAATLSQPAPTVTADALLRCAHQAFQLVTLKSAAYQSEAEWRLVRGFRYGKDEGTFFDVEPYPQPRAAVRLSSRVPLGDLVTGLRFGPGADRKLALQIVSTVNRAYQMDLFPEFSRLEQVATFAA